MSTRSISWWGKGSRCVRLTTLPPSCAIVMKSGNLNFPEPSGPLRLVTGLIYLLPLILQYTFSFLLVTVNNKDEFRMNSEIHSVNIRITSDFIRLCHICQFMKKVFYTCIKVYNSLPPEMKGLFYTITFCNFVVPTRSVW